MCSSDLTAPDATEGESYSLALTSLGTEPEGEAVSFSATGLPSGLTVVGNDIVGTPTEAGTFSVSVTGDDAGDGDPATTSFTITVAAAPTSGGLPAATLTIFDDAFGSGAFALEDGSSVVSLSSGADPVYEGSASLKVTASSWAQGGIDRPFTVDAANNILRFRVYRPDDGSSGFFLFRHGSNWAEAALDDTTHANWRLNGNTGQGDLGQMAPNTWHLVEIDLTAMGITEVKLLTVMGNATGNDTYFFDQVETTDQFSTGG